MNKITITIKGIEYTIKQTFRTFFLFEEMSGKSIALADISTFADTFKLLYCALKANNKDTFKFSFDEFVDIVDEQPEVLSQFSEFMNTETKEVSEENKKKVVNQE